MRNVPNLNIRMQYPNCGGMAPVAWRICIRSSATRQILCLVAFSEPPSVTTWLENAPVFGSHFPS
ncbi:MAG: hypothetical protein ACKPB8_00985, partial [Alphaproteobacteria bacterium]